MRKEKEYTIQIVGGGMLGLITAFLAVSRGYSVCVYRVESSTKPDADSQRNHAWLQSGLFYLGKIPKSIRRQMRQSGIRLLETFGVPVPTHRGIFGLKDEVEAQQLVAAAAEINIQSGLVARIEQQEARQHLGPFYVEGQPYFWVPDVPFDEGRIMTSALAQANGLGAQIVEMKTPVTLRADKSSPCGVVVEANGRLTASRVLILAAGARTKSLLHQIAIDRNLMVSQSPLLVTPGPGPLQTPLFVNRRNGLTIVRHLPYKNRPDGCLVIGNSKRTQIDEKAVGADRLINDAEKSSITELLPSEFRDAIISNPSNRYTAGHKTELCRDGIGCTVEPWIEAMPGFPGLFASVPGKATMALVTAENLLNQVDEFLGQSTSILRNNLKILPPTNNGTTTYLHHEDRYNSMNDAQKLPQNVK